MFNFFKKPKIPFNELGELLIRTGIINTCQILSILEKVGGFDQSYLKGKYNICFADTAAFYQSVAISNLMVQTQLLGKANYEAFESGLDGGIHHYAPQSDHLHECLLATCESNQSLMRGYFSADQEILCISNDQISDYADKYNANILLIPPGQRSPAYHLIRMVRLLEIETHLSPAKARVAVTALSKQAMTDAKQFQNVVRDAVKA